MTEPTPGVLAERSSPWATRLLLAVPLLFGLYAGWLVPRPYYVYEMDAEPDYYYNARLIVTGHLPRGIHHPGTPVYYLGAGLLRLAGTSLEAAPAFFRLAHASACVALFLALLFFRRRVGSAGATAAVTALAAVLAWPTVYTYADFFAADSFVLPVALVTVVLVRAVLRGEAPRPTATLLAAGAGAGACLAVKMSAVPVAVAAGVAVVAWRVLGRPGERPAARAPLLAFFSAALGTYLALVAPVLDRIAENWIGTFSRPDARPPASGLRGGLRGGFLFLSRWNPLLAVGIVAALAGFVLAAARLLGRRDAPPAPRLWIPEAILVGLMALGFLYAVSASAEVSLPDTDPGMSADGPEPGVHFRNVAPTAAALPLLVLFAFEHATPERRRREGALARAIALFAFATLAVTVVGHGRRRAVFIATRQEAIRETRAALEHRASPPERLAFWTGPSTDLLGEASFHFWGNYRYAEDAFDRELLDAFPGLTFFRGLREMRIGHIGPERVGARRESPPRSERGGGPLRRLHEWMKRRFPPPVKTEEFFAGERYGVTVAEIAIPSAEAEVETRHAPASRLVGFLTAALRAPAAVEKERIGAIEWTFARPGAAPAGPASGR